MLGRSRGMIVGVVVAPFTWMAVLLMIACSEEKDPETAEIPPDAGVTQASTTSSAGGSAEGGSGAGGDGGRDPGTPTVFVTPDCVGITDVAVELSTTRNNEFTIDGEVGFSMALSVDDVVRFSTPSDHNFESVPATPPQFSFKSGEALPHSACLRFTAPTPGPIGFECDPHAGDGMVGTLTVE